MWLLEANTRELIEQAERQNVAPTVEKQAELSANYEASMSSAVPRIMSVAGDKAEISVQGVLTKSPDWLAMIFGGGNTTYPEIISSIAAAEQNPDISEIILAIDSPGGHFDGLFDVLGAIKTASKPVRAEISNLGASAAFAIATQADTIVASNKAARIGSVGVAATFRTSENEVTITSTEAPRKRPDVSTEEGKADVRQELDAMHDIFVESIAGGRSSATSESFTAARVNKDFGRGATLLAEEALKQGMIDGIDDAETAGGKGKKRKKHSASTESAPETVTTLKPGTKTIKKTEVKRMDIATLKAEHRETYAAVVQVGVMAERDRAAEHLIMGEASGDLATAVTAVKEGTEMTGALRATYMTAGMNKNSIEDREDDDPAVVVKPGAETPDTAADTVADAVCEAMGYEEPEGGKV